MKKLIHIVLIVAFALSVLPVRAQNNTMAQYWDDVDFSDSTLVLSKELPGKLVSFFYSFTDGDEQRFDSLSIVGLGVVLDKAKTNMKVYEFILDFALNGYSAMGRDAVR
jgi:hypothetical protein